MSKTCGKGLVLQIGDGEASETFTTVGVMTTDGVSFSRETTEVTNKGSNSSRELINCGIATASINGNGFISLDDAGQTAIVEAFESGDITNFTISSLQGDSYVGPFQVTSLERSGEYNGAETFTWSAESAGEWTYTAPV